MRMTSESSNLLLLIDDAIQSSIECSNFYDSLSTVKDNALNHALVLEKQLEVARGDLEDSCKAVQELSRQLEKEVSIKEEASRKAEELMREIDHKAIVAEEVQHDFDILSERLKIAELEASITIAQLHQVQEKLEYYLLLSQQQAQMLEKSANLQERTAVLLANSNR